MTGRHGFEWGRAALSAPILRGTVDEIPAETVHTVAQRTMAALILDELSDDDRGALDSDDGLVVDGVAVWWTGSGLMAFACGHEAHVDATDLEGGTLHAYDDDGGERLGPATVEQHARSILAAHDDGGAGVIDVDGSRCFVR